MLAPCSCAIACLAQFYPQKYPASTWLLAGCVAAYMVVTSLMTGASDQPAALTAAGGAACRAAQCNSCLPLERLPTTACPLPPLRSRGPGLRARRNRVDAGTPRRPPRCGYYLPLAALPGAVHAAHSAQVGQGASRIQAGGSDARCPVDARGTEWRGPQHASSGCGAPERRGAPGATSCTSGDGGGGASLTRSVGAYFHADGHLEAEAVKRDVAALLARVVERKSQ